MKRGGGSASHRRVVVACESPDGMANELGCAAWRSKWWASRDPRPARSHQPKICVSCPAIWGTPVRPSAVSV